MKIRRKEYEEDHENAEHEKSTYEEFAYLREEAANDSKTIALIKENPKLGKYWCAVAPTGKDQNQNVGVRHNQLWKRYDEFREHAQTALRRRTRRQGKGSDP